jgi:hypothetical protein
MTAEIVAAGPRWRDLACYLAGMAVVLFMLQRVAGTVGPIVGRALGRMGGVPRVPLRLPVLHSWLSAGSRRRILWRLRNRLIVTYVFIGVIPVQCFLVAMAGFSHSIDLPDSSPVYVVISETQRAAPQRWRQ